MPKIRAVIFDCYRTLVDIKTNEAKQELFVFLSRYLQYYGADISGQYLNSALDQEKELYLKRSGELYPEVNLEVVFVNVLRKAGLADIFLAQSCCKLFRLLSRDRFQLFPDSLPVLKEMKREGYPLALVSDAQKVFSLEECKILGLSQVFDHVVLSTQFGFTKPDPRLFSIACSLLDVPPEQAVYVGNDPERDVKGARQIGMKTILVDRDSGHRGEEPDADLYAADLWEALGWVKGNS